MRGGLESGHAIPPTHAADRDGRGAADIGLGDYRRISRMGWVASMFRFTIRDVLWLTVVVALGVGWLVDRRWLIETYRGARMAYNLEADYADRLESIVKKLGGSLPERWTNEELDAAASKASKVAPPPRQISN
jgi:hypothetical protein